LFSLAALIKTNPTENKNCRRPTDEEILPLQQALDNPGKSVTTTCSLVPAGKLATICPRRFFFN